MTATIQVPCPAGVYTPLSTGQTNVSFRAGLIYGGKMIIAASLPLPGATNFKTVSGGKEVALGSLAATDIVYWQPAKVDETIEVIRG
jgi:hypothetical protein